MGCGPVTICSGYLEICLYYFFSHVISLFFIFYSGFGSVMFNLGSMLLWALGRTVAPENSVLRTLMGIAGAAGGLYLGKNYVLYLDSLVKAREE